MGFRPTLGDSCFVSETIFFVNRCSSARMHLGVATNTQPFGPLRGPKGPFGATKGPLVAPKGHPADQTVSAVGVVAWVVCAVESKRF